MLDFERTPASPRRGHGALPLAGVSRRRQPPD